VNERQSKITILYWSNVFLNNVLFVVTFNAQFNCSYVCEDILKNVGELTKNKN